MRSTIAFFVAREELKSQNPLETALKTQGREGQEVDLNLSFSNFCPPPSVPSSPQLPPPSFPLLFGDGERALPPGPPPALRSPLTPPGRARRAGGGGAAGPGGAGGLIGWNGAGHMAGESFVCRVGAKLRRF